MQLIHNTKLNSEKVVLKMNHLFVNLTFLLNLHFVISNPANNEYFKINRFF